MRPMSLFSRSLVGVASSLLKSQTRAAGAFCLIAALAGCHTQSVAAGEPSDPLDSQSAASGTEGGFKTVSLKDASLGGIDAMTIQVPAGWRAGGEVSESPCSHLPSVAWEAGSPHGETRIYQLATFAWKWGSDDRVQQGCIPLHGAMSASSFLQSYLSRLGGVKVIGPMPVGDALQRRAENMAAKFDANTANMVPVLRTHTVGDVAAVRATNSNGQEMRFRSWVQCSEGARHSDCFARLDIALAPKGKLDALVNMMDSHNMIQERPTPEFMSAYSQRQQQRAAAGSRALSEAAARESAMLRKQYEDSSARLNAEHQAGMEQIQRQGQSAMANANNAMNARSTAASDWIDYAGDKQTVSGVNGTYKTSSQFTNVWSSPVGPALSDGRTFGSTDNTLDPNTATDNTWTKDKKVHGNGQPY